MIRLVCLLIGYCFGLIQTSFILGKLNGIDIRDYGSGNAGTTNALRVLGTKAGVIVFFGDALKALFAVLLVRLLFKNAYPDMYVLLGMYSGAGAVCGHIFPAHMGFRGGKGVACTAGLIASMNIWLTLAEIVVFGTIAIVTNYVSLGSLVVCLVFFGGTVFLGQTGHIALAAPYLPELYAIVFALGALTYWKHRSNIVRLLNGTERKSHLFGNKGDRNAK